MRKIPIVFVIDKRMEMPAGVCIFSLLSNADKETFYDIFILHSPDTDFSHSGILQLQNQFPSCCITFRPVDEDFRGAYEIRSVTKTTYYKLLIPKLVPEYDKILYSDVDVIFRDDLSKYLDVELGDSPFAGVNSVPVMNEDQHAYIKSIGINPDDGYFYAGNLVINSRLIRESGMIEDFLAHKDKRYRFQEMDIINLTCTRRIKPLSPAFCLTVTYYHAILQERDRLKSIYSEEELDAALEKGIVHYNGAKPWNEVCLNMDIWWDYYRKSIFFNESFAHDFWYGQMYRVEKMSLWKRVKLVGRYFRKGGRK